MSAHSLDESLLDQIFEPADDGVAAAPGEFHNRRNARITHTAVPEDLDNWIDRQCGFSEFCQYAWFPILCDDKVTRDFPKWPTPFQVLISPSSCVGFHDSHLRPLSALAVEIDIIRIPEM